MPAELPEPSQLTVEMLERESIMATKACRDLTAESLRLVRARYADWLNASPPEDLARIIELRGSIVHKELQIRAQEGLFSKFARVVLGGFHTYELNRLLTLPAPLVRRWKPNPTVNLSNRL